MRLSVLYSVLVSCLVSVPVWGAQSEDTEPMLEFHCVGLYDWPVTEKDWQMMETVKLLKSRLVDLAGELDFEPFQKQMMLAGWDLFTADTAMRLNADENGISGSVVFEPGDTGLGILYSMMTGFLDMSGLEFNELTPKSGEVMGPMGPVGIAYNDERIWLSMGEGEVVPMAIPHGDLPKGVEPVASGRVDIGGLIEFFAPELLEELELESSMAWNPLASFLGPDAPVIEFNVGVTSSHMHMTTRMIGAAQSMASLGINSESGFEKSDFKRIPKDAVRVSAFQTNVGSMLSMMEAVMEESGQDQYAEFSEQLGVDLVEDVLGNIGDRAMFYQSEATGGGGLLSMVVLIDLRDAEGFGQAHAKIVERVNALAQEEIDGYARIQAWGSGEVAMYSITTPGIPIPLEPSWMIEGDALIVALSPGALEVAAAQYRGETRGSIVDNKSFKEAILSRMPQGKAQTINYYDAARLSKKGYGMTSMLASALSNAARSPKSPGRVLGSIMPDYNSFTSGVAPSGTVSWWDGDDLRMHYVGDGSMLVQISAGLGSIADVQGVAVPALAAGVLLPALGKARERAKELVAITQVRSIIQGMFIYAGNNNDQAPESLEVLIDQGLMEYGLDMSPFGPAYDGRGDIVIRTDSAFEEHMFNSQCIVAIDRAMLVNGHGFVAVGFADAHVELVDVYDLYEMLEWPENEGAAEALDIEDY